MKTIKHTLALALLSASLSTPFFAAPALAATPAPAVAARTTFDGQIRNNSLSISPDESMAVVSYSERSEVVVYDLRSGTVRGTLSDFVTPRNIDFAPDGESFYVSDSSRGEVLAGLDRGDGVAKRICALSPTLRSSQEVVGLNPSFAAWTMGLPAAWDACAPTATRSTRKRPSLSSNAHLDPPVTAS